MEKNDCKVISYYKENYDKYGISPQSLGWIKGKQFIRFERLTHLFELERFFSICDFGCGFGDLNSFFDSRGIKEYRYYGFDFMEDFIGAAEKKYQNDGRISFRCCDILDISDVPKVDYVIGSGIFNVCLSDGDNYSFVERVVRVAMDSCNDHGAVAFDFQSDKVDYQSGSEYSFYFSPEKILEIAYSFSRNVILDNSYFPFEFSVVIFKDDSFSPDSLIFNTF